MGLDFAREDARYCSTKCRVAAHRARHAHEAPVIISAAVDYERNSAAISAAVRAMDMDALITEMVAAKDDDPERFRELNVEFNIRCRETRKD